MLTHITVVLVPRLRSAVFKLKEASVDFCEQYKKKYEDTTGECTIVEDDATSVRAVKHTFGFEFAKLDRNVDLEAGIDECLEEPQEPENQGVIAFYMCRKTNHPILYRMARDFFAAPAMSAPTEPHRSRLISS